ncbi:MAG: radical SAM protein [Candidatus Thermoplasmatota archaeon]|nr:radical SAM protein [Candidatus Thermoplasmatota archaeon]
MIPFRKKEFFIPPASFPYSDGKMRACFLFDPDKKHYDLKAKNSLTRAGWSITNRCNQSCATCYADSSKAVEDGGRGRELDTEECLRVVDIIKESGVKAVVIGGGEPMVRPDIFEIARYANKKGLSLTLATNGTLIDESNSDEICNLFQRVAVSLNGFRETHNRMRGETYDLAIRAMNLVKGRTHTSIAMLAGLENMGEAPKFFEDVAVPLGINEYRFMRMTMTGRNPLNFDYNKYLARYVAVVQEMIEIHEKKGYEEVVIEDAPLVYPEFIRNKKNVMFKQCFAGFSFIMILPDGRTTICPLMENSSIITEHVFERSLKDIYDNNELFIRARNVLDCKGCKYDGTLCFGGCRCGAVGQGRNVDQRDPHCPGPLA